MGRKNSYTQRAIAHTVQASPVAKKNSKVHLPNLGRTISHSMKPAVERDEYAGGTQRGNHASLMDFLNNHSDSKQIPVKINASTLK